MKDTDPIRPRDMNGFPIPQMRTASNLSRTQRVTEHDRPGRVNYRLTPIEKPGIFQGIGPILLAAALCFGFYAAVYRLILWGTS